MSFFTGTPEQIQQYQRYDPAQQQIYQNVTQPGAQLQQQPLFQGASQFMQDLFSGDMSAFQAPLLQQFEQETIPGISEQFAGLGMGASSGLNQTLARAAENLGTNLGAQRSQLMMSMLPQALQYSQAPMQEQMSLLNLQPQGQYLSPGTEGMLVPFAKGAATLAGNAIGGPVAGVAGNYLADMLMNYLGGGRGGQQGIPRGQQYTSGRQSGTGVQGGFGI